MSGSFGSSPSDDGVVAATGSSSKSGVFGRNDSPDTPPPGTAGGSGVFGLTVVPGAAGVFGANNHASEGRGVQGNGPEAGVSGFSERGAGVLAHSKEGDAVQGFAHHGGHNALLAMNDAGGSLPPGSGSVGGGVLGVTNVGGAAGVFGANNHASEGRGVQGNGPEAGVSGFSERGAGVLAHSKEGDAVQGFAHKSAANGILGNNDDILDAPTGGAPAGNGVFGFTKVPNASGVCGAIEPSNTRGAGVTGIGQTAGHFFGNVIVTGDVQLSGADVAEDFLVIGAENVEPGTVMVLDGFDRVRVCNTAYDHRVVGVVSGAGDYRPGVVLNHKGEVSGRTALGLIGKVFCKVDASSAPVEVGDLLTTSSREGHAMKATDAERAFGAVLGKAMAPLTEGSGLLPVLIALH